MHYFPKKNKSIINFLSGKYQYKICAPKYCDDKTFDKDVSMDIDVNSLIVINEYVFVQVCVLLPMLVHYALVVYDQGVEY